MSFRPVTMIQYSYTDVKKMDAVFDLITDDKMPKGTTVIGAEDSLIYLVTGVLNQKKYDPYQSVFYGQATPFRSQIALVRLLNYMKSNNQNRGAIVIGAAHIPDFVILAKLFGIKTNIFDFTK